MNVLFTKQQAHDEIECIFRELLPQNGMAQRPEQIRLCHSMLDAMLDGSIALCDAGTGIGKTFAYQDGLTGMENEFEKYMEAVTLLENCGVPRDRLTAEKAEL